jgi:S-adenosyl methyltransferase
VVRYLAAECGVRQFLDIGIGLPAPHSTHQVAQAIAPDSRIVYADNDPLVTAAVEAYNTLVPTTLVARSHARVSAPFGGLPLVPPGVVPITEWRPATISRLPNAADLYAGVARAPGDRR